MWWLTWTETDELKLKIEDIVRNRYTYRRSLTNWIRIIYLNFDIYIETDNSETRLYDGTKVCFNDKEIFNRDKDESFFLNLVRIIKEKNKTFAKIDKENALLKYKVTISEALASITTQGLNDASKEVQDEFAPIFDKVRRVQEITKELESIRREFSIL